MATTPSTRVRDQIVYPTRDGRPMGESDVHRDRMFDLIQMLQDHFAADPMVCVSGNLLIFYEPGNKRKHVAPDVFVVRGVPKRERDNYLVWEEGRGPDLIIELTSRSTRHEDQVKKFELYRDVLRVSEYFLFDPRAEYLKPPLQGHRLIDGQYVRIEPVAGRLPSVVLGLELEAVGNQLRFYNPATGRYLPTPRETSREAEAARQQAEAARQQAEAARQQEAAGRQEAEAARQQAEAALRKSEAARKQAEAAPSRPRPRPSGSGASWRNSATDRTAARSDRSAGAGPKSSTGVVGEPGRTLARR